MRSLIGLVCVLVVSPIRVSAQEGKKEASPTSVGAEPIEETQSSQSWLERMHPEAVEDPLDVQPGDEPAAQLSLQYEERADLDPYKKKVRNAKLGLGLSGLATLAGAITFLVGGLTAAADIGNFESDEGTPAADAAIIAGAVLMGTGGVSMIATGVLLRSRKRTLREMKKVHYGTRRRVQWDLARSRLVF